MRWPGGQITKGHRHELGPCRHQTRVDRPSDRAAGEPGKHVLRADLSQENADAAAEALSDAVILVSTATVDLSSPESVHTLVQTATALGDVTGVIHAAGVSPSQAAPETILSVDLYGIALVLEEFGNVIAPAVPAS